MKEFFVTILFIIVFLGVPIFLACLPFLIRDRNRESRRKARQQKMHQSLEQGRLAQANPQFHITVRLTKHELMETASLTRGLHQSWWVKLILTLIFLTWLIRGSAEIGNMVLGHKPHEIIHWIRCSFGVLFGGYTLWSLWIVPWLFCRRVQSASEMEISMATETSYHITADGIRVGEEEEEGTVFEWSLINYVEIEEQALRIVHVSKDIVWIPRESLFHMGYWASLVMFLHPLEKSS